MRIGIVNDLPLAAEALRRALLLRPQHQVVWTARDGQEAVACCLRDTPDLVLMDLVMPGMDGVEATRQIMARCPCAILVVTASVSDHASRVFEAMGAGALDAVDTPALGRGDTAAGAAPLLAKVDLMGRLAVHGLTAKDFRGHGFRPAVLKADQPLVAIGASAGGPAALAAVLGALPKDFPASIVIIQHVDEQFAISLAAWLQQQSPLPVVGAREGDTPRPSQVLLAVKNDHLIFTGGQRLGYSEEPKEVFYRPSADVFFQSIVRHWKGNVIGVLLTGMGRDGALGLKALRDAGFHTIAQDQATCAVYGMPKAAAALNAAVEILPLDQIGPALNRRCRMLA